MDDCVRPDGVKKNFLFQILYQFIILVLPLITAPYLTRVLGDSGLGNYTFTYSIAYYFVVLANLGIARHGQRSIAIKRNDEIGLRRTFYSLFSLHFLLSFVVTIFYFVFCLFQNDNRILFIIQGIYVCSAIFDITWFFYGIEKFKSVVLKNFIVRVVETVLVFILVKTTNDVYVYATIKSFSFLIGNIILIPQVIKIIKPIRFTFYDIKEHIKPLLILSITIIASTLYTAFDKTLLGILTTKENVAYYEYSDKIIMIGKSIIAVAGTVLFPRACSCFANGDNKGMNKYFKYSILFSYYISFAMIFGLLSIGDLFAVLYYGPDFAICGDVMKIMSVLILICALGDIIRTQLLIPMHKDMSYTITIITGCIINLILSLLFIPIYGIYGALIGSIAAECSVTIFQFIICRKYIKFKIVFVNLIPFLLAGIFMWIFLFIINDILLTNITGLILRIIFGGILYTLISVILILIISKDRKEYIHQIKTILKVNRWFGFGITFCLI